MVCENRFHVSVYDFAIPYIMLYINKDRYVIKKYIIETSSETPLIIYLSLS